MKTKVIYYALLMTSVLALVSCGGDDDDDKKSNSGTLLIDGHEFKLTKGFVRYDNGGYIGPNGLVLAQSLAFTSDDVEYAGNLDFNGRGATVSVQVFSLVSRTIEEGTYEFENVTENEPFFFDYFFADSDYDFDAGDPFEYTAEDGTIVISRSGEKYTVTFTMQMENGSTVSGSYIGPLEEMVD